MPTPRTGKANNEKEEKNKRVHTELGDRLADERRSAERAYWQDQEQLADEIRRGLKFSGLTKDQLAARAAISTETLRNALSSTRRQKNPISMNTMHRVRMAFRELGIESHPDVQGHVPGLNWIALPDAAPQATVRESLEVLQEGQTWINDEHLHVHDEFSSPILSMYKRASNYYYMIEAQRVMLVQLARVISAASNGRGIEVVSLTCGHGWNDILLSIEVSRYAKKLPIVMYLVNCNGQILYDAINSQKELGVPADRLLLIPTQGRHHTFYRYYPFDVGRRYSDRCRLITIMGTYFNIENGIQLIQELSCVSHAGDLLFLDVITPWGDSCDISIKRDPRMNQIFDWASMHEGAVRSVIEKLIPSRLGVSISYSASTDDLYRSGSMYTVSMDCSVDIGSGPLISVAAWRVHRHDPANMVKQIESLGWRQVREFPLVSSHWNTGHLLFIKD